MDDSRFSHVASDPRFKPMPRHARKIKIDSRFRSMFTDRRFKVKYLLDKRGRRVKQTSSEDLQRFYDLEDSTLPNTESKGKVEESVSTDTLCEEEEVDKSGETSDEENSEEEDVDGEDDIDEEQKDEYDSSTTDTDDDFSDEDSELHHGWGELDKDVPVSLETSSRLAVCNMDWDHVSAQDLFVVFSSWQPRDGCVHSVTVYPSDFGLERMSREELEGPSELTQGDDANEEGEGYSQEKLRQYQLNRLKYYYAIVECDSSATAEHIYNECNGTSFETSGTVLDLRFVPDEMQFDDRDPFSVSTALTIPSDYKPPNFITSALQQSTVHLTWDATDHRRVKTTMRNFSKDDLMDMDFSAYIASSEEEDEWLGGDTDKPMNEEEQIQKYRALLGETKSNKEENIQNPQDDQDEEMCFTLKVGLEEKGRTENSETVKEDSKPAKGRKKRKSKEEEASEDTVSKVPSDGSGFDDPFFSSTTTAYSKPKKNKKLSNMEQATQQKEKSELELLVMSDTEEDGRQHFSLKKIMESEKQESKKGKKRRKNRASATTVTDPFKINLDDPRFSAIYDSHLYSVDPSDPHYKPTKGMEALVSEKQRRRHTSKKTQDPYHKTAESSTSLLIKSVKHKTASYKKRKLQHKK